MKKIFRDIFKKNFWPKNDPFPHIFHINKHFPQRISSVTFTCLLNPNSKQKIRRSNELILRKWCYRRLDGLVETNAYYVSRTGGLQ